VIVVVVIVLPPFNLIAVERFVCTTNGCCRRGQLERRAQETVGSSTGLGLSPRGVYVRCRYENTAAKEENVNYLLQIYPVRATEEFEGLSADEQQAIVDEYLAIGQSPGVVGGEQLQPVETATTVRIQNGETLLTDGPFVDAKEHLGGFLLVEADDLDAALEIAARIPAARMGGAVEVRPLVKR
jgi:hypothetical protein